MNCNLRYVNKFYRCFNSYLQLFYLSVTHACVCVYFLTFIGGLEEQIINTPWNWARIISSLIFSCLFYISILIKKNILWFTEDTSRSIPFLPGSYSMLNSFLSCEGTRQGIWNFEVNKDCYSRLLDTGVILFVDWNPRQPQLINIRKSSFPKYGINVKKYLKILKFRPDFTRIFTFLWSQIKTI